MANEQENGFDAGEFYAEGMAEAAEKLEAAGVDPDALDEVTDDNEQTEESQEQAETTEKKKEEKNAADSSVEDIKDAIKSTETETEEEEPDSLIAAMLPKDEEVEAAVEKPDGAGKYVPVDDHIKLRKRAQEAERERDELRQRLEATTSTGGEKPGKAEKSPLEKFVEENPDEDIVPAKVQLEERNFQNARQEALRNSQQRQKDVAETKRQAIATIKAIGEKAVKSESEFRKVTKDYEKVITSIVKAKMLSDDERAEAFKDSNPAKKLYEICKAKVDALRGVIGDESTSATTTPKAKTAKEKAATTEENEAGDLKDLTEGEDLTDDEIGEILIAG